MAASTASIRAARLDKIIPPIWIESDHFEVNFETEQAVWRGHVEATQGNYTFRASSLTLRMEQIQTSQNTAETDTQNSPSVIAGYELSADSVSYDLDRGEIVGRGNCELRRGVELIRAEHIVYKVHERTARAQPLVNGRVQVQILSNPERPLFPAGNLLSAVTRDGS